MKKSKFWSILLAFGAVGLAIGGANFNRKVAPTVFAHHEDHIKQEVEGHSKVRPTVTPERAPDKPSEDAFEIKDKETFETYFNNGAGNAAKNAYLSADVDLDGASYAFRMHGDYTAIFEGNGFTVSNFSSSQALWVNNGSGANQNSEIRNANFRLIMTGNGFGGIIANNHGKVTNVNVELTIKAAINSNGGIANQGSGLIDNCHVDWIFQGGGASSNTLYPIVNNPGANVTNCSYYVQGHTNAAFQPASLTGIAQRTESIVWGDPDAPSVEVESGYINKIYVEEAPSSVTITAQLLNTEEPRVWSVSVTSGGEFAAVVISQTGVTTVTAVAKGTISFKIKATVGTTEYSSSVITIKVLNNTTEYEIPDDAHEIKDVATFNSYFTGGAEKAGVNAYLSADIDLQGKTFSVGMGGEFSGIFEGQGHTIYNYNAQHLFNLTSASSIIRNLNLVFTTRTTFSGQGAVAHSNGGLIQNVRTKITLMQGVHTYGGIALVGSGRFENCHADFIVKATDAHDIYPIVQNDGDKNLSNCSWTLNGAADTIMAIGGNANKTRDLVRQGALGFQLLVMAYEGGDIATEECAAKWSEANAKWNAISADSRTQVRDSAEFADAWFRYQHWALANGSSPEAGTGSGLKTNNNLNLTATIIIGAIGLTTLVGYYFINKKKVHA